VFKSVAAKTLLQRWKHIIYAAKKSSLPALKIIVGFFELRNCTHDNLFVEQAFLELQFYAPFVSLYLSVRWWEPYINSSFYLLGVDNKLSTCLSICKAVRAPYQLVPLAVRWQELQINLSIYKAVRTPYQLVSLAVRWQELQINLSIYKAVRTPYQVVSLSVKRWELLTNSLSLTP